MVRNPKVQFIGKIKAKKFTLAMTLMVALTSGSMLAANAQEPAAVSGNAENGARLYFEYTCYGCHGFNGQTGRMDFVGRPSPFLTSEEVFRVYLRARENVNPLLPSTDMPSYPQNTLDDQNVSDLYAYIRSMQLDAPDITSISVFQSIIDSAQSPYEP